jgi:SAM-dependent methyltransferase
MTVFAEAPAAIGAGGCDWLAIWQQMYDAERAQTAAHTGAQAGRRADRWAGRAGRFAQAASRTVQPDAFMRALLPQLQPTDVVLDIGAGTGRHATFLAGRVAQVIVVEPSASMREHLEQRLVALDAQNMTVVPGFWPIADIPFCDIAICAHVAYGVREIEPFLTKMDQAARRGCFVLIGFHQPSFVLSPFWEAIYGEPRLPLPGALECLNVLYQLGIPAQLALLPASRYVFANRQEALEDLRWRLALPDDIASDARLVDAMDTVLQTDESGGLAVPEQPDAVALLWWTHTDPEQRAC